MEAVASVATSDVTPRLAFSFVMAANASAVGSLKVCPNAPCV
jgi:hypothetical protein